MGWIRSNPEPLSRRSGDVNVAVDAKHQRRTFTDAILVTCEQCTVTTCEDFGINPIQFNDKDDPVHLTIAEPHRSSYSLASRTHATVCHLTCWARGIRPMYKDICGEVAAGRVPARSGLLVEGLPGSLIPRREPTTTLACQCELHEAIHLLPEGESNLASDLVNPCRHSLRRTPAASRTLPRQRGQRFYRYATHDMDPDPC
jgi:hypothetical protein